MDHDSEAVISSKYLFILRRSLQGRCYHHHFIEEKNKTKVEITWTVSDTALESELECELWDNCTCRAVPASLPSCCASKSVFSLTLRRTFRQYLHLSLRKQVRRSCCWTYLTFLQEAGEHMVGSRSHFPPRWSRACRPHSPSKPTWPVV